MYDGIMEEQKSFSAHLSELYAMLGWVCERLGQTGLSDIEVRRIEIALEEGLVNVISYAYQGEEGKIALSIRCEKGKYVEITIEDSGLPFNPLKHKRKIDPFVPVEDLEEGGLGILFMQKLMDKVEYQRFKKKNQLTIRKNLP
ncbi:ATP-binding protein [Candidatus Neptunichlamydia sp. REUL1]|uniref:ATP-binding protein n=1 Tax=Candidatus Neptunichlamydia sp. REUL1 TaxID=3064277 RepID=UPI00292F87EC|nr:ATP-binding protein [Candidatus Neptunochlamydia sp. REUL1]